jgi:hypothetical protein
MTNQPDRAGRNLIGPSARMKGTPMLTQSFATDAATAQTNGMWYNTVVKPGQTTGPFSGDELNHMRISEAKLARMEAAQLNERECIARISR